MLPYSGIPSRVLVRVLSSCRALQRHERVHEGRGRGGFAKVSQ